MTVEKWGYGKPENKEPFATAIMGSASNGRPLELLWGDHPHARSDNRFYARDQRGTIHEFDGHRILIDVRLRSENYLKESYLSGDQIRKGGSGALFADGVQVYEFFFRDIQWALLKAHRLIGDLSDHCSNWLVKKDREQLVGRRIWYDRTPGIIKHLIEDQGAIIIEPEGVAHFPRPVYADKDDEWDQEDRKSVKDDVLSKAIWWWRDPLQQEVAGRGLSDVCRAYPTQQEKTGMMNETQEQAPAGAEKQAEEETGQPAPAERQGVAAQSRTPETDADPRNPNVLTDTAGKADAPTTGDVLPSAADDGA